MKKTKIFGAKNETKAVLMKIIYHTDQPEEAIKAYADKAIQRVFQKGIEDVMTPEDVQNDTGLEIGEVTMNEQGLSIAREVLVRPEGTRGVLVGISGDVTKVAEAAALAHEIAELAINDESIAFVSEEELFATEQPQHIAINHLMPGTDKAIREVLNEQGFKVCTPALFVVEKEKPDAEKSPVERIQALFDTDGDGAIALAKKLLEASPDDAPVRSLLGQMQTSIGLYIDAIQTFELLTARADATSSEYFNLAIAAIMNKEIEKGKQAFATAFARENDVTQIQMIFHYLQALSTVQAYDEAFRVLEVVKKFYTQFATLDLTHMAASLGNIVPALEHVLNVSRWVFEYGDQTKVHAWFDDFAAQGSDDVKKVLSEFRATVKAQA